MAGVVIWIALAPILVAVYLRTHTHIDDYKIVKVYGGLNKIYKLETDKVVFNLTKYYRGVLIEGHIYRIKWVDGIRIDRILSFEEVG